MAKKIRRTNKKGAITREEMIDQHNEEISTANNAKKSKTIVHLVKNYRIMEYEKHIQVCK